MSVLRHPVLWIVLVLLALTALWHAIGAPISLITQIAIYMLYGAGVNLLVGYTGLAWISHTNLWHWGEESGKVIFGQ
jgi:ABC-type branched-subunit amino acid transport system permease subunit